MAEPEQATLDGIDPDEVQPAPKVGTGKAGPGRPRGSKGRFRSQLDHAFRSQWRPAYEKLMQMVKDGDPFATRVYWDRVFPRPNRLAVTLENLPEVSSPADARAAMGTLLKQVTAGALPTDDAQSIMAMLGCYLAAHNINTVGPTATAEVEETSSRDLIEKRLLRAIEERQRQSSSQNGGANGDVP